MIVVGNKTFETGDVIGCIRTVRGAQRETLEIVIKDSTYAELAEAFVDGASILLRVPEQHTRYEDEPVLDTEGNAVLDEDGQPFTQRVAIGETTLVDYPKTEYYVAGDIIDRRDGSFLVYMSVRTEAELECEQKDQLMLELLKERGSIV